MKKPIKWFSCLFLLAFLLCNICGCSVFKEVPTVSEIQEIFERDKDTLMLLKDYFIDVGYETLCINDDCETARGDQTDIQIEDPTVVSAFKQLKNSGYQTIYKYENTIVFHIWSGSHDAGCGIAYAIDGVNINVPYLSESAPLTEDGWFYYVDDFNEWRSRQHETE